MENGKQTYYVSIQSGETLERPAEPEGQFKIVAVDDEVNELRRFLNENYGADLKSFLESHVPFKQFHTSETNPEYDSTLKQAYGMIYQLGDQETKRQIESMGVLETENLREW